MSETKKRVDPLLIENADIIFRNFAGRMRQFNEDGSRNFCLMLEPSLAEKLKAEGWNIKTLKPRENDEEQMHKPYLQVTVEYGKGRPPRVVLITSKERTELGVGEVEMIDWVDIKQADVLINPYQWEVNANSGVKAYLKSAFITILEDPLELKYGISPTPEKSNQTPAKAEPATDEPDDNWNE